MLSPARSFSSEPELCFCTSKHKDNLFLIMLQTGIIFMKNALFFIFGVCKIRCRFGAVLEGSGGGFWSFLEDFGWILGL